MNNKIIQVRGGNATGKTTLIRKFIDSYTNIVEYEVEVEKGLKSKLTSINDNEIIILGRYTGNGNCFGCDRDYSNREHIIKTLCYVMKKIKPKAIIYEGLIYGKTVKMALDVFRLGKLLKYDYKAIYLHREFEECIKLLEKRNEGANYNILTTKKTYDSCLSSYLALKEKKINIKKVDVSKVSMEDMADILLSEV